MFLPVHVSRRQTPRSMLEILLQVREWIRCVNESSGETRGSVRPGSDRMGSFHMQKVFVELNFVTEAKHRNVSYKLFPCSRIFMSFDPGSACGGGRWHQNAHLRRMASSAALTEPRPQHTLGWKSRNNAPGCPQVIQHALVALNQFLRCWVNKGRHTRWN